MAVKDPVGVHLVGSINLNSAEEVFQVVGSELGNHLYSIPDGETDGLRPAWVACQLHMFTGENQELYHPNGPPADGINPHMNGDQPVPDVNQKAEHEYEAMLENIHPDYDVWAIESYKKFKAAKEAGTIPQHVKFQVSVPTPLAVMALVVTGHREQVERIYTRKLKECLHRIADAIPHSELAIQWDVAMEFAMIEKIPGYQGFETVFITHFHDTHDVEVEVVKRLKQLELWTPDNIEIGFHMCYGDLQNKHFKEPENTQIIADLIEQLLTNSDRKIGFIQFSVPRDRNDTEYFQPLAKKAMTLAAEQGTILFPGLIHPNDKAGSQKKIEAFKQVLSTVPEAANLKWGVASECGWGRTPRELRTSIMDISKSLSAPVA